MSWAAGASLTLHTGTPTLEGWSTVSKCWERPTFWFRFVFTQSCIWIQDILFVPTSCVVVGKLNDVADFDPDSLQWKTLKSLCVTTSVTTTLKNNNNLKWVSSSSKYELLCFRSVPHEAGRLGKGVQGRRVRVDPPLQEGDVLSGTPDTQTNLSALIPSSSILDIQYQKSDVHF